MQSLWSNRGGSQSLIAGVAIICIAVGAYFIFKGAKSDEDELYGDVYYYCTNCEKEFAAGSQETPPIKCKFCGKLAAVAIRKYKCKGCGHTYIGYLEKYDPETKVLIERRKKGEPVPDERIRSIMVAEPDSDTWLDASSPEGTELMNNVVCPKCESFEKEAIFPGKKK